MSAGAGSVFLVSMDERAEEIGELVYLKCTCCDKLVEHRCPASSIAKVIVGADSFRIYMESRC